MKNWNISWVGIVLVLIYVILSLISIIKAQYIIDPKGKYIYLHFPITIQHQVLRIFDSTYLLRGMSWPTKYLCLGTPMIIVLYLVGSLTESLFKSSESKD